MNELTVFYYRNTSVRTLIAYSDDPLFCSKDVCKALGYACAHKAIAAHVDKQNVTMRYIPTDGGKQPLSFINESGLFSLIHSSQLETAKDFKLWVESEVLPSIRQTGRYGLKAVTQPRSLEPVHLTRDQLDVYSFVLEKAGLEGDQLVLALDKVVKSETGKSVLALSNVQLAAQARDNHD